MSEPLVKKLKEILLLLLSPVCESEPAKHRDSCRLTLTLTEILSDFLQTLHFFDTPSASEPLVKKLREILSCTLT